MVQFLKSDIGRKWLKKQMVRSAGASDKSEAIMPREPLEGDAIALAVRSACEAENRPSDQLVSLDIRGAVGADWETFPELPALRTLDVRQCNLGNEEMAIVLSRLSIDRLEKLVAVGNPLGNRTARRLAEFTNLRQLALDSTRIADAGVESLAPLVRLQRLGLGGNGRLSDHAMKTIGGMNELVALNVSGSDITDAGLECLVALRKTIQGLGINGCRRVSRSGLRHIAKLDRLERLTLNKTDTDNEGLAFLKGLTSLKQLGLAGTLVTNEGIPLLEKMNRLSRLFLSDTRIDDAGVETLASLDLGMLQLLELNRNAVTDAVVESLRRLNNLRRVALIGTQLSTDAVEKLQELCPNLTIMY
jgi:Leucine-rich repeat (LRR) protein